MPDGEVYRAIGSVPDAPADLPESFVRAIDAAAAVRPQDRPESPIHLPHPEVRRRAVAVLPFVDAGSIGSLQYFCDGMAEELSNALAAVPGLRMTAHGSSSRFRAASDDVRRIGAMLNVGMVLEGSVRTVGNQVRVASRLVDTIDGAQVWSERFDRRLDEVFAIQDEIARAVMDALRPRGARPQREQAPGTPGTRDFEAYALYLKGRYHWNKRTDQSLHKSVAYFQSAIDRDPEYAEAHAGLASAEATLGLYGAVAPPRVMPDARSAAERALALKPGLSGALATCACVAALYDWKWSEAGRCYRRAIEENPSDSDAQHWFAINHLVPLECFDEARLALQRAADADPLSVPIAASAGLLAYFAHQYEAACDGLQRGLEIDPHAAAPRMFLGLTHVETGNHVEAIRELTIALQLSTSPETMAALGYARARAGHRDRAEAAIGELVALTRTRYVSPSLIAQIHAGLGDAAAALEWIERAFSVRAADLAWLAVRPVFAPLRTESRFTALLEQLGVPSAR